MENEIIKLVPETVFERAVTFEIALLKPSLIDRLRNRKKRVFSIRPATLGTMIKISSEFTDISLDDFNKEDVMNSAFEAIKSNAEKMARVICFAICNSKESPPKSMIDFFLHNLTAAELSELVVIVLKQIDTENFLKSIISARGINLLSKMNPQTRGSTLAPGKPSEG